MWVLIQVLALLVVTHDYLLLAVRVDGGCVYQKHEVKPDVYYINMDKSKDRKEATEKHLSEMGYNYHRVRGITPQELFIPDDLMKTWDNRWCMVDSEIPLPDHLNTSSSKFTGMNLEAKSKYTAIITGMCGRKRSEAKKKYSGEQTETALSKFPKAPKKIVNPSLRILFYGYIHNY